MLNAKDLKQLSETELLEALAELTPAQAEELLYTWEFWARPEQLEPKHDYKIWMPLAGRGWGKTRTGAETVRSWVKQGFGRIACVAPTKGDVRRVMVEGDSGLLSVCHKNDRTNRGADMGFPVWSPTNNTMTWANGAKAEFYSAEDPERLRGPQFHRAWCDELAAWRNMQETWDMLQFGLRLGKSPKVLITTTPKPVKIIRRFVELHKEDPKKYYITTGSSYENSDNIDMDAFQQYEGTRLGRQELYAEILPEAAGALWSRDILDKCSIDELPDMPKKPEELAEKLLRIVVSVDPAITSNEESDMTGIIVAGIDVNGTAYVLEDATDQYTPEQWSNKAIQLYNKYNADMIVYEKNQGGDMVKHTFRTADDTIPLKGVHASKGKYARAEPVSALYERGKVYHCRDLHELETQMVTWEPLGSIGSPDRLDALVWAITNLLLKNRAQPTIKVIYGKE